MPLYWFILLPFVGSLVAAMMPTKARNVAGVRERESEALLRGFFAERR